MEKRHKNLDVWQLFMELAIEASKVSEGFPKEEKYNLTDQARRASVSVPSNIAEGAARQTKKEFVHCLHLAQGSLGELDTQLEVARRLGFLNQDNWRNLDGLMQRVDKMLTGLIRHERERKA